MIRLIVMLTLLAAMPAFAQEATPKHYANAAERILNDPSCLFNSEEVDKAVKADIHPKPKPKGPEPELPPKAKRFGSYLAANPRPAPGPRTGPLRPLHKWNKPAQLTNGQAYIMGLNQAAWMRANTPALYVGPVVRVR